MQEDIISGLISELRRGSIVLSMLILLRQEKYGYSLVQELAQRGLTVEANTLYPLLRRLEKQGMLDSSWQTDSAKPRKYYKVTPYGQEICSQLITEWKSLAAGMDSLLEEGNKYE